MQVCAGIYKICVLISERGRLSLTDMSHKGVISLLIKRGATVDLPNAVGGTALMLAAENGNVGIVWELLRAGADPDALNEHEMKALQHAVTRQHRMTAALLRRATSTDPAMAESAAAADPELFLGRLVAIRGLPELNGRRGKAASYDADKGCIDVLLEGGSRVVMVKPANLELVDAERLKDVAAGPKEIASGEVVLTPRKGQVSAVGGRRGLVGLFLPSPERLRTRRTTVSLTLNESPVAKEPLPADVLLAAFLGQTRAVRAWLDAGGRVDARAQGRAGGEWTLLMAAAEGGRDGRRRYEAHVAAYRAERQRLAEGLREEAAATKAAEAARAAAEAARKAEQRARFAQAYATPAAATEAAAAPVAPPQGDVDTATAEAHPAAPAPASEPAAVEPAEPPSPTATSSAAAPEPPPRSPKRPAPPEPPPRSPKPAPPEPPPRRPLEPTLSDKIISSAAANASTARRSHAEPSRQSHASEVPLMESLKGSFARFAASLVGGGGGGGGGGDAGDDEPRKASPRRASSGDLDATARRPSLSFSRRASFGDAMVSPRSSSGGKLDAERGRESLPEPVGRGKKLDEAREALKLAEAKVATLGAGPPSPTPWVPAAGQDAPETAETAPSPSPVPAPAARQPSASLGANERAARLARAREKVSAAEAKRAAAEEALRLKRET